ncbi:uncharacterized protein LOC131167934 [Malania oleifera]|uniref:uncharacterized protein LOC131167934 n=1 Tax=Malania oleifera TaxID=397392 RepID=UPI0025AE7F4D|nr:uncharacterized protein LOC131167934 [Malania oleifera]
MPAPETITPKFSYQRLRNQGGSEDEEERYERVVIRRARSRSRVRVRVPIGKRLKVKIPSLRRFLRRKARLVLISWAKVVQRLKKSQSHLGDLFAGNYLFMQVSPTPLKFVEKSYVGHGALQGLPSRFSLGKLA